MPFSQASIDFLVENAAQDSRDWFRSHRGVFDEVLMAPFVELVDALAPRMLEIDPHLITEAKVDRTLSRIYRDTRFSQDKSLYRENMWLVFMREKKLYEGLPAFYFDMGPDGFSYGMGYYRASSASMQAIRRLILDNSAGFRLADKAYRHQNVFGMEGECYKRSKYPDASEHQQEWLNRKSISFNCTSGDERLLFSDELAGTLQEGFCLLAPIYEFLCQAETQRDLAAGNPDL